MSQIRDLKLGQLEQLRQKITALDAKAANAIIAIELKTYNKSDLSTLDVESIHQAAMDLKSYVNDLRRVKKQANDLHEELYG
ncbi:MAG: hypothetical protein HKK66_03295 [Chlorobiaceae bacterium]|nr:hypothetical protein [Chlorobiaceae bacterium]